MLTIINCHTLSVAVLYFEGLEILWDAHRRLIQESSILSILTNQKEIDRTAGIRRIDMAVVYIKEQGSIVQKIDIKKDPAKRIYTGISPSI